MYKWRKFFVYEYNIHSGISDALLTSIRNFATVEGIAQNSSLNLEKLTKQLDRMDAQTSGIERGLDRVCFIGIYNQ
jgi:hypothetical protein